MISRLIIVLGKGLNYLPSEKNPKKLLRDESKQNVLAAYELYKSGVSNTTIVFTGGKTAGPAILSEAELMAEYFKQIDPSIHPHIILEKESFDTIQSIRNLKFQLLPELDISDQTEIMVISISYHLRRVQKIFSKFHLRVDNFIPSEPIAAHYQNFQQKHLFYFLEALREQLLIFTLPFRSEHGTKDGIAPAVLKWLRGSGLTNKIRSILKI